MLQTTARGNGMVTLVCPVLKTHQRGSTIMENEPDMIGGNVGFYDGSVQWCNVNDLDNVGIASTNVYQMYVYSKMVY